VRLQVSLGAADVGHGQAFLRASASPPVAATAAMQHGLQLRRGDSFAAVLRAEPMPMGTRTVSGRRNTRR